jgi:hypothetical protein
MGSPEPESKTEQNQMPRPAVAGAANKTEPANKTLIEKHMNQLSSLVRQSGLSAAALAAAFYAASLAFVGAADTNAPVAKAGDTKIAQAKTAEDKAEPAKPKKEQKKQLAGAELYAINCSRCHPERYPTEWNPAQWKTLMLHMRVRANLPAVQAKVIAKYLQEEAGN